jgi:hypothetical protein
LGSNVTTNPPRLVFGEQLGRRTFAPADPADNCNIFGERRWITKYPQIRIALRLIVAALVGLFVGIFVHWIIETDLK